MKLINVDEENLHIFRTTREMSMKFSKKICLMIISKVTKNQGFTRPPKDTVLETGVGGGGGQIDPPRLFRVKSLKTRSVKL